MVQANKYAIERLRIPVGNTELAANLYLPAQQSGKMPVVVVLGPVASVKEQSPMQYATRLAKSGYATLTFDPRYYGHSGGEPRQYENGQAKSEDISAAVQYLKNREELDAERIYGLGICQGVNWMIRAANADKSIKKLALVSGHFLTPAESKGFFAMMFKDDSLHEAHISEAIASKEKFEESGEVDYIHIVGDFADRLLPHASTAHYYLPWETADPAFDYKGKWQNKMTKMSEAELWQNDVQAELSQLQIPVLAIAGTRSATSPGQVQSLLQSVPHASTKTLDFDGIKHLQFYEDPEIIDRAAAEVLEWYAGQ